MASIGLNVSRDGAHDPALVKSLQATWIRIVAMAEHDLTDYFVRCRAAGLKILLVLARESGGDYSLYLRRYGGLISAVQVGNEPDIVSPSSWTMTPVELSSLAREARKLFPRPMPMVCAGLASGHPTWLDGMDLSMFDALGVHPYGKTPSETWPHPGWGTGVMGPLLDGYAAFGKPLLITELGLSTDEVPEDFQAEYVKRCAEYLNQREDVEVWFWFCISDTMV